MTFVGAMLVALLHKVLREGIPIAREGKVGDTVMQVKATSTLPAGAIPAFIGAILILAVLIEPYIIRRKVPQRLFARLMGWPLPIIIEVGGVAIEGARPMPDRKAPPLVDMRGITKSFGAVNALVDVNLSIAPGEILGLVGDNSAGKSTPMKILTGAYHGDQGEVLLDGRATNFRNPHESRDAGIEMIYQDFALCGNLDVAQNIFLGRWPRRGPFVDRRRMYAGAGEVLQRLKVEVNSVYQKVESLSGGRQQSVAIARAISFHPKLIVLDEPTANLSVTATGRLLETMAELKAQGVAQIIISHRLTDIFEVADRVMVLKRGQNVGECLISAATEQDVLHLMVAGIPTQRAETEDQPAA